MKTLLLAAAGLLAMILIPGCGGHEEHESLLKRIRASESGADSGLESGADSGIDSGTAVVAPGEALIRLYKQVRTVPYLDSARGDTVYFQDRRPQIKQFPCSECHAGQGPIKGDRRAHFGLTLSHAKATVMACATCHGDNMKINRLASLRGESVPFEFSFQVCSQCHFQQARDVLGGAHGKRLLGWQGPRIIQNCTGCHNPHSPALPKRWPATTETRTE